MPTAGSRVPAIAASLLATSPADDRTFQQNQDSKYGEPDVSGSPPMGLTGTCTSPVGLVSVAASNDDDVARPLMASVVGVKRGISRVLDCVFGSLGGPTA